MSRLQRYLLALMLLVLLPALPACLDSSGSPSSAADTSDTDSDPDESPTDDPDDPPEDPVTPPPGEVSEPLAAGIPEVSLGKNIAAKEQTTVKVLAITADNDGQVAGMLFEQIEGNPAVITSGENAGEFLVTLPAFAGSADTLRFQATVTDNDGLTATDEIAIEILQRSADVLATVRAGVAVVDATGPVGGSAGQYASVACDTEPDPNACTGNGRVFPNDFDPHGFSTGKKGAYGVHSRVTVRALVIEGNNGKRVALVKSDNYLAQDMLQRRVAQILAAGSSGIGFEQIMHSASHSHSSPYQLTQAAGIWVFQDRFSEVAFERMAQAMAGAIETAAANLQPARLSAVTVPHDIVKANIVRGAIAVDGTPAGYPVDFGDNAIVLLRVDDLSVTPPRPMAYWMNHGQHPESLDGYHLISADFLAPLERYVERELAAPVLFTQGDVGSAEGPYAGDAEYLIGRYLGLWTGFAHEGYAQLERQGRILADAVIDANALIDAQDGVDIPWTSDFPVDWLDHFVAGPVSHPSPTLSNCDAQQTYEGNLGAPAAGLPDCARSNDAGFTLPSIGPVIAAGAELGAPVPGSFSAPGHPAVEENQRIHLQTFRLGEILLASCACEPQVDLILNLESRADNVVGNIYNGYDWSLQCDQLPSGEWDCPNPRQPEERLPLIPDSNMQRMLAQVHNDAAGWENELVETTEPPDPSQIKGNFTHEELTPDQGYQLVVGLGHTGDYNGYTVSYREYQSRDSYRKALTAYGPHTADYMNTRLVRMGGKLKGGPDLPAEPTQANTDADEARQAAQAEQLGQQTAAAEAAFVAGLLDDPGAAEITQQPAAISHFSAAVLRWRGGSNALDNPLVTVERREAGDWLPVADMSGEVQTRLTFPGDQAELNAARAGQFEWQWEANFEAFPAFPDHAGSVAFGEYRFVVLGVQRKSGANRNYQLISDPFLITPWPGITVQDVVVESDGSINFLIDDIVYPRSYESEFFVIGDDDDEINCETCSFGAWATEGEPVFVSVTVTRGNGSVQKIVAENSAGRWHADTQLQAGDSAELMVGDIVDNNGEVNTAAGPYLLP